MKRKPLTQAQRDNKNARLRAARARAKMAKTPKPAPKKPTCKIVEIDKAPPGPKFKKPKGEKHSLGKITIKTPAGRPITIPQPKISQNGITRPRSTWSDGRPKTTAKVWEIADLLSARLKRTPTRLEMVIAVGEHNQPLPLAEQITFSVFQNQFYAWRKFNGINGPLSENTGVKIRRSAVHRFVAGKIDVKPLKLLPKEKPPVGNTLQVKALDTVQASKSMPTLPFPVPAVAVAKPVLTTQG